MKLEDFISKNSPKRKKSVFDEYLEDIKTLLSLKYSQKQIIEYLKTKPNNKNKSGISEANLSSYLKKVKKSNKLNILEEDIVIENKFDDNKKSKPKDPFENLKK